MALLYNWVTASVGGIKMELETVPQGGTALPSPAPQAPE